MVDDKLARDEAERAANYEAVRSSVEHDVGSEVAARAGMRTPAQAQEIEETAREMRRTATSDVAETHREVGRARVAARISQFVDYFFLLIYSLLAMRLVLDLLGARESAGFYQFVETVTDPFYYPFRGLLPSLSAADGFELVLSIVVAIVAYMLLHLAINGLLRIVAHRKVEV